MAADRNPGSRADAMTRPLAKVFVSRSIGSLSPIVFPARIVPALGFRSGSLGADASVFFCDRQRRIIQ